MKENFKSWYNALNANDKKEVIRHILKDPGSQTLIEKHFTNPGKAAPKGLFTGPVSSGTKCPKCGKEL